MAKSLVLVSLVIILKAYDPVRSCSCPPDAFSRSRIESIRTDYKYTQDVYTATVISATCNCFPAEAAESRLRLNCHSYQLEPSLNVINASIVAQGQCATRIRTYSDLHICPDLGQAVTTTGFTITVTGLQNMTSRDACNFLCPFNANTATNPEEFSHFNIQPCLYTVRVGEVFKGNFSVGDELVTIGPDVLTTCGSFGRVLRVGTEYLVGIGGTCSLTSQWSESSSYSANETEFLKSLSVSKTVSTTSTTTTTAMSSSSKQRIIEAALVPTMAYLVADATTIGGEADDVATLLPSLLLCFSATILTFFVC